MSQRNWRVKRLDHVFSHLKYSNFNFDHQLFNLARFEISPFDAGLLLDSRFKLSQNCVINCHLDFEIVPNCDS